MADRRPRPVYWKPTYPTRTMRERAYAKREAEREREVAATPGPSFREWLRGVFRRG